MKYDNELGIEALYCVAAEVVYQEHGYSTVRRDFVPDPMLINPPREFVPDTTLMVSDERFELPLHGPKPRVLPGYTNRR